MMIFKIIVIIKRKFKKLIMVVLAINVNSHIGVIGGS